MQPRALPQLGAAVVIFFLAAQVRGEVVEIDVDQRGLTVLTAEGETVHFRLERTTGKFHAGGPTGARLYFED